MKHERKTIKTQKAITVSFYKHYRQTLKSKKESKTPT